MSTERFYPQGLLRRRRVAADLPRVVMPASWPSGLGRGVAGWLRAWQRRRHFLRLLDLDDHLLDDVGYSRDEVCWAARLPLRVNAAVALSRRRRAGRGDAAP